MRGRNQVRIIAGEWRGRRLGFPNQAGLRPTPDRVRETVFNWLMPMLPGSRCLDLFAGSGALGFEAASRGASQVVMVEKAAAVARHLRDQVRLLQAEARIQIWHQDAMQYLAQPAQPFDVIFLDPPYGQGWLPRCLPVLADAGWLAPGAAIYIEAEQKLASADLVALLPTGYELVRSKLAGEVGYHLARIDGSQVAAHSS